MNQAVQDGQPPARRAPAQGRVPRGWAAVAGETDGFEAETETDLLAWMTAVVTGIIAWGGAVADVHEYHVSAAVRLDPAGMAALHDVADAAADAAEAMARAREQFREVYERPREFVSSGGVLPADGDYIAREGE
jgi:hypothetical protein